MFAQETKSDWTTAEGTREFVIYEHSTPILRVRHSSLDESLTYVDGNHGADVFPGGSLVREYYFIGDTSGDDAGVDTGVRLSFRPIEIDVEPGGVAAAVGSLYLTWMGVVDNGEGDIDNPPLDHGPYGNIHLVLFDDSMNELKHLILTGPSKREWTDGDSGFYNPPVELHAWRNFDDRIYLFMYESDGCDPDLDIPIIGDLIGWVANTTCDLLFDGARPTSGGHDELFEGWFYRRRLDGQSLWYSGRAAQSDEYDDIAARNPTWLRDLPRLSNGALPSVYVRFETK